MVRRVDIGELNTIKNDNDLICNRYTEYKNFNAEKYNVSEQKNDYNEFVKIEEVNTQQSKPQESKETTLERDKLKDISNSNSSQINTVANTTSTATVTTSTTLAASTSVAASTVATAAVGVISFLVITNIDTIDYSRYFEFDTGSDYAVLTVDYDELEKTQNNSNYSILVDVDEGTVEIKLNDSQEEYFIGNLQINTKYNYCLVLNEYLDDGLNQKILYEDSFTTASEGDVKVIYDTSNNFIEYDYDTLSAYLNYSLYLSDYNHSLIEPLCFITSAPIIDIDEISNIVYDNYEFIDNFFIGKNIKITYSKLYLNVVGFMDDSFQLIYSKEIDCKLPDDFRIMEFNGNGFGITYFENSISITNEFSYLDENKSIYYYIIQYDEVGNILNRNDQLLATDLENMTFEIYEEVEYSMMKFQYGLYTIVDEQPISLYDSEILDYYFTHEYKASYQVMGLSDANITYYQDHIAIEVNSSFISYFEDVYQYKLKLYNGDQTLIDEYIGVGVATFDIYDFSSTSFYLEYVEIGLFNSQEIEYQRYITDPVELCIPNIILGEGFVFEDEHFIIDYYLDMIYDYEKSSIILQIEDGSNTYTQTIEGLYSNDTIYLDSFDGEIENAKVTATLVFKDNQQSQIDNLYTSQVYTYDFNYSFAIEKVLADMYVDYEGSDTVPITIDFSYMMPTTYQINISDSTGVIDDTFDITEQYYFNKIAKLDDSVLTIQVLDEFGNQWKDAYTYNISFTSANTTYKEELPVYNAVNPYGSLVTYNEDGTINIYRKINFSCTNENIYCNAFIYNNYEEDPITGQKIYQGGYDAISNSEYAIIENVPDQMYILNYQLIIKYEGVDYIMYVETPSGTISPCDNVASAYIAKSETSTIISINCSTSGKIENKISCLNNIYEYSTYQGEYEYQHSIVFDEILDIESVGIYFSIYYEYYDEYSSEITLKGNLYKEYIIYVEEMIIEE